jgi:hypothetical protein
MSKKNQAKGAKKVAPNKEVEKKDEETVVEDETVDETAEDETTEDADTTEGSDESEESEEEESEEGSDDADNEEEDEDDQFEDASQKTNKFAVYQGGRLVKIYNAITHGEDYQKIAKAHAKRLEGGEAKPFYEPKEDEPSKDTVRIVNASNSLVREFSLATHGKGYKDLANAFVEKHGVKRGYRIAE